MSVQVGDLEPVGPEAAERAVTLVVKATLSTYRGRSSCFFKLMASRFDASTERIEPG